MRLVIRDADRAKFDSRIMLIPYCDCWVWDGGIGTDDTGVICLDRVNRPAHRVAWSIYNGEIPHGYKVERTCGNRLCVKPGHLTLKRMAAGLAVKDGASGKVIDFRAKQEFYAKIKENKTTGCWEWQASCTEGGYGQHTFNYRNYTAHRFSWLASKGDIPVGMCVLHRCDNRRCANPDHLFLGTNQDNTDDMFTKQRAHLRKGEHSGMAKLTDNAIREIRQSSLSNKDAGIKYGIDPAQISNIKNRKAWSHVEDNI